MTSSSAAAAVSLGNGEIRHKQQTVANIRAGKGGDGGGGADVSLATSANEVTALNTLTLDTAATVVSPRDHLYICDIQENNTPLASNSCIIIL